MKIYRVFLFFFITQYISFGQAKTGHEFSLNLRIQSAALSEPREIDVYLPPEYYASEERNFPVMYLLDGQEYFLHPISYQRMLKFKDKSPAFIVIGINSDRRKRRQLYYRDADKFIRFLQNELIPFIDNNYRTLADRERIYFGWEMAGGLGIEIFNQYPSLFNSFLLSSPTHFTDKRLETLGNILEKGIDQEKHFYITRANSKDDIHIEKRLIQMEQIAQEKSSKNITWEFDLLENDDHYTTPTKTIHNGLKSYFSDYDPVRFFSLKDYDDFGGMDALKTYYKKRANRYGISDDIHKETKHFLLLQTLKANDFSKFEFFANTFSNHFPANLSTDFWVNRYAQFYLTHNKVDRALELYQNNIKKFPNSSLIYNGIAEVYKQKEEKHKAKVFLKKAIKIARFQNDPKLDEYIANLEKL